MLARCETQNVYTSDVRLTEECLSKRETCVNTAFELARDPMLEMELRRFAFIVVQTLQPARVEKFDKADLDTLQRENTSLQLSRKKSSWSMMLSGQAGALTAKPSLYYKVGWVGARWMDLEDGGRIEVATRMARRREDTNISLDRAPLIHRFE